MPGTSTDIAVNFPKPLDSMEHPAELTLQQNLQG